MKSRASLEAVVFVAVIVFMTAVAMPVLAAEITRISIIDDTYIGKVVSVSGVIVTISNNIPETGAIQTYDPGGISVLKLDDGSGTLFVSSDPRLLDDVYEGLWVMATGLYAGDNILYADMVGEEIAHLYIVDITVNALNEFPEYYYNDPVRIRGNVTRIEQTAGKTELLIDDHTGEMAVTYNADIADIMIGDEVLVEGKFYRNMIGATAVTVQRPEPEATPSPTPIPSVTPTPTLPHTSMPMAAGGKKGALPFYIIVIIIAAVVVAGVLIGLKVKERLMRKQE
jgi:DNA/RNA endonuclease YhcR with UshA esterase domain